MTADDFYPAADSSNHPTDISSAIAKYRLALEDNSETPNPDKQHGVKKRCIW